MSQQRWSRREVRDVKVQEVIAKALAGDITWRAAEQVLGFSARHVRRLRERAKTDPALGDRRAGRRMPKRVDDATVREVLGLREKRYFDFNIKHFHQVLRERHQITCSYTYIRTLLQQSGLAERAPQRGKHRRRRDRRPMAGMMLHMDGSSHAWLGQDLGRRDLIYVLDDATGEVEYARFVREEDTRSCLAAVAHVLRTRGLFAELYVDRGSHFVRTPSAGGPVSEGGVQFARVLRQLHIRPIYAKSPQARGRSERAFRTVQGRLPQELREAGVKDWDATNIYLTETFVPGCNRTFAVAAAEPGSAYTPVDGLDIDRVCALEHDVTIGNDNCIRWRRRTLQVPAGKTRYSYARCAARLVECLDGRLAVEYGRQVVATFDAGQQDAEEVDCERAA